MGKKKAKNGKGGSAPAPVETGHDSRASHADKDGGKDRRGLAGAPDGVTGNWS